VVVTLVFIRPGKANHNAFFVRLNSSFRYEVLDANLFNSIVEAQEPADVLVMYDNEFSPHNSLGNKTPVEFMSKTFKAGIFSFELST
jgi:putative transposase